MTVRLSPATIAKYFVPSRCNRRIWLAAKQPDLEEKKVGPFDEFLKSQGIRHEKRVLDQLRSDHPDWVDVRGAVNPNALEDTISHVHDGRQLIYQGKLAHSGIELSGREVVIVGYPDFMIKTETGYHIADAKLTRAIYKETETGKQSLKSKYRYITLQLQLYGWLFHQQFPALEVELSVINGRGAWESVPLDGGRLALECLETILDIREQTDEPWEAVGWSKCLTCSFHDHCWAQAESEHATGLVPDLDQNLGRKLREEEGIETYPALLDQLDASELAAIKKRNKGADDPRTLASARRILENAGALREKSPLLRASASPMVATNRVLLSKPNYVMFDLEGIPPDIDQDWDKVYLWGLQVFGEDEGNFRYALAGFEEEGDRQGWETFLAIARSLLDEHPGICFVHWAKYEKNKITLYMERYPDTDLETAEEVLRHLLDLLDVTKKLVAVPEPSYSLKVIEEMPAVTAASGFSRAGKSGGGGNTTVSSGDESIAAYMEAVETRDEKNRQALIQQIVNYNEEDLKATWAVLVWLRDFLSRPRAPSASS